MAKPKITVLSLGGTISMVQGKSGVVPGLNADDLIAAAPGIDDLAILTAESRPGGQFRFDARGHRRRPPGSGTGRAAPPTASSSPKAPIAWKKPAS